MNLYSYSIYILLPTHLLKNNSFFTKEDKESCADYGHFSCKFQKHLQRKWELNEASIPSLPQEVNMADNMETHFIKEVVAMLLLQKSGLTFRCINIFLQTLYNVIIKEVLVFDVSWEEWSLTKGPIV